MFQKYSNETYSAKLNNFIKHMAVEKHATYVATRYPLFKLLRATIKLFMLNQIEILFYAYVLENNKWIIDDDAKLQS
jgi:hypothetical protein